METAAIVLEYLKVLLSTQCVCAVVALVFIICFRRDLRALMQRVASIKLPGGTEVSAPQLARTESEKSSTKEPPGVPPGPASPLPEGLHLEPEQAKILGEAFRAERAKAYLWEYRYLNHFLVANTQRVLDWLAGLKERTTISMYDAWWMQFVLNADERRAILSALETHHLIFIHDGDVIEVTPKGREYIGWRGPLASPPAVKRE